MCMEKWKKINGYDYEVSTLGRVRNSRGKILKLKTENGYKRIGLYRNNRQIFHRVHRLVAVAFIPKINGKEQVHHINHVRDDNRVHNLQWVTCEENQHYKIQNRPSYRFLLEFYNTHKGL